MPIATMMIALALQAASSDPITVVRRHWAPFISPMGEPFRSQAPGDDTLVNWFAQADRDRDGVLIAQEMQADAERFFALLDTDRDGAIGPEEMRVYEWDLASEIQVNSQWRRARGEPRGSAEAVRRSGYDPHGLQGAARYGLLNMPQPVASADTDLNRAITLAEFRRAAAERFALLDRRGARQLKLAELQAMRPVRPLRWKPSEPRKDGRDERIAIPVPDRN
jgi:hypothetical protein